MGNHKENSSQQTVKSDVFGVLEGHSADFGSGFFIREAVMNDAAIIWQTLYDNRDYLSTWLPFVVAMKDVENEEEFLRSTLSVPYEERDIVFVIGHNRELCGLVGFVKTDVANHRTEIGYWLIPEYQGKGIMTRCVRHLCRWAVRERGMNRIQISCAKGNGPSNAVPRRLGFSFEGSERQGQLLASGEYTDIHFYSILREEVLAWKEEE